MIRFLKLRLTPLLVPTNLKQIAISVIITVLIPALGGLVWGAPVAFVLATIAKAAMSGYAFIQLFRNIYNTIRTEIWASGAVFLLEPWKINENS